MLSLGDTRPAVSIFLLGLPAKTGFARACLKVGSPLRLAALEAGVTASLRKQFLVRSLLDELAVVEDADDIGVSDFARLDVVG